MFSTGITSSASHQNGNEVKSCSSKSAGYLPWGLAGLFKSIGLVDRITSGRRPSQAGGVTTAGSGIADSLGVFKKAASCCGAAEAELGELSKEVGRDAAFTSEPRRCASSFASIYIEAVVRPHVLSVCSGRTGKMG